MRAVSLLPFLGLLACTPFPELGEAVDRAALEAPFPQLRPLEDVLAAPDIRPVSVIGLSASRLDRLRARAAALRGPVIDAGTRARMRQGVSRPF